LLSNGRGEDGAAALIAAAVRTSAPDSEIHGVPLVGDGRAYRDRGITVDVPGANPASGGFSTVGWRAFVSDLPAAPAYIRIASRLRALSLPGDAVVVVGDVFALLIARVAFGRVGVFLSLPKSSRHLAHTRAERLLIGRWADAVLTRDVDTAAALCSPSLPARFLGNPLMDDLEALNPIPSQASLVAFLPGSRREAIANLPVLLNVAESLPAAVPAVFAFAPWLDRRQVERAAVRAGWVAQDDGFTRPAAGQRGARRVTAYWGRFTDVIHAATLVVGMAGTASEQAAGLGRVVVTCPGGGPQSSRRRLREQQRLLGGAAILVNGPPQAVAAEVVRLLDNAAERERRGALGRACMGPPGASARIGRFIVERLGEART